MSFCRSSHGPAPTRCTHKPAAARGKVSQNFRRPHCRGGILTVAGRPPCQNHSETTTFLHSFSGTGQHPATSKGLTRQGGHGSMLRDQSPTHADFRFLSDRLGFRILCFPSSDDILYSTDIESNLSNILPAVLLSGAMTSSILYQTQTKLQYG
jgi:hypothetical protein